MAKPPTVAQKILRVCDGLQIAIGDSLKNNQWLEWLNNNDSFRYMPELSDAPYTCRKERAKRGDGDYWYGYRKINGKLHKRYVGKTSDLTTERLEAVAQELGEPTIQRQAKVTDKTVTPLVVDADDSAKLHKQIAELTAQLIELQAETEKLQNEKQQLQNEKQELHIRLHNTKSGYEAKRDRILSAWKIGKRAESKERIKQAIDRFIELLDE